MLSASIIVKIRDSKKEKKKKVWGKIKKLALKKRSHHVLRILDGRGLRETQTHANGAREYTTPFAVMAFVQRGVAEWRRVSRYRGEACDV